MKKKFYTWISIGILFFSVPAFGQKTVVQVTPGSGTLTAAITAAGANVDNTIFELERGGVYTQTAALIYSNYTLHIRAAAGSGPRPVINANGRRAFFQLDPNANITLEGVHLTLHIPDNGLEASNFPIQVRSTNPGSTIIIDDCYFDYSDWMFLQLNSANNKVYIKNSIMRNSTRWTSSTGNGRVVDTRGNDQDVISIENSTLYANSSGIINSSFFAETFVFNHNTVFFCGYTAPFYISQARNVSIMDNIFYNSFIRGSTTEHSPIFTATSYGEAGKNGFFDADRQMVIKNNNFYVQQEIRDTIELRKTEENYTVRNDFFAKQSILDAATTAPPLLITLIQTGKLDTANNFMEPLVFLNPPPLPLEYFTLMVQADWNTSALPTDVQKPYMDENPATNIPVIEGAYDFSYNNNARSATAATGDQPLGAFRWVPYVYVTTSAVDYKQRNISVRSYPNPVMDNLTMEINIQESAVVNIRFIDLTGKEVHAVRRTVNEGTNPIQISMRSITNAGVYFYQVQVETIEGKKTTVNGKILKK